MRLKDLIVGAAMTGAGIVYLRMAGDLPAREGVDAASVPGMLAWMMIGLGLIEMTGAWRRAPAPSPTPSPAGTGAARGRGGLVTVALTLLLIAGFVAALRPLGFPIATALYLFAQFLVLTPRETRPPVPLYGGLAVGAAAVIFVTFRYGFDLLLPAGPLVAWLN